MSTGGDGFGVHDGAGVLSAAVQLVGIFDIGGHVGGIGHILPLEPPEALAAAVLKGALNGAGCPGDGQGIDLQGLPADFIEVDPQDTLGPVGQKDGQGIGLPGLKAVIHAQEVLGGAVKIHLLGEVELAVRSFVVQGEVDIPVACAGGVGTDHVQILPADRGCGVELILSALAAPLDLTAVFQPEPYAGLAGLAGQVVVQVVRRGGKGHDSQHQSQDENKPKSVERTSLHGIYLPVVMAKPENISDITLL